MDVMRLVEVVLVLVVEGRKALPKTPQGMGRRLEGGGGGGGVGGGGERPHRQVIESIRSGNNEEFFEAMEAGVCVCVCVCIHACVCVHTCMCVCVVCVCDVLCSVGFDVNFMDDVGQTLLNWASAFGTFEMVRLTHTHTHTTQCTMRYM